jgi:hypothetical protein
MMVPDIVPRLPESIWVVGTKKYGGWMILGIEYDANSAVMLKRHKKREGIEATIVRYPIEGHRIHKNNGGGAR